MEKPQFNQKTGSLEIPNRDNDIDQWNGDTSRLLRMALMSHDPELLQSVHERISLKFGDEFADSVIAQMITHLMTTVNWSFIDEDGKSSPLL